MFAILALFGDLGCSLGPEAVAVTGSLLSDGGSPVKTGLAYSIVFPVLNVITIIALFTLSNKRKQRV